MIINYIVGLLVTILGLVAVANGHYGGAGCCFIYSLCLWLVLAVYECVDQIKKRKENS